LILAIILSLPFYPRVVKLNDEGVLYKNFATQLGKALATLARR